VGFPQWAEISGFQKPILYGAFWGIKKSLAMPIIPNKRENEVVEKNSNFKGTNFGLFKNEHGSERIKNALIAWNPNFIGI
jgi:hypothetical protein